MDRGRIATLEQQLDAERIGREFAQRRFEKLLAEHQALRDAIANVIAGNFPRPRETLYREDGKPSKHDKCKHGPTMYEDCEGCVCDYLMTAMGLRPV